LKYFAFNNNDYFIEEAALMFREREKHPYMFGQMPLIVLTRGMPYEQEHINKQQNLLTLSHNSKQIIAEKSGHHIQLENPDLVVKAIREVMEAVKKNKRLTE
jgi:hypothetical protein